MRTEYKNRTFVVKVKKMATKFKKGDEVKIKKSSEYYGKGSSNPANKVGKVLRYVSGYYEVSWGKNLQNDYEARDLEFANEQPTTKRTKKPKVHTTSYK